MNNATQTTRLVQPDDDRPLCTDFPEWCDLPADGHTEHIGEAELTPAIATAASDQLRRTDDGVLVAHVRVSIHADRTWNREAEPKIAVEVVRPDGQVAVVRMTVAEADVLRGRLLQAVVSVRSDVTS